MNERMVAIVFLAGLLPAIAFGVCLLALFRAWCGALKGERDALRQLCQDLERRLAEPAWSVEKRQLEEAARRLETELAELREQHAKLQALASREKERIHGALQRLRAIRDAEVTEVGTRPSSLQ